MLFGIRVGSKGTGEETFTIRIPINMSPTSKITITPGEIPLNIGRYPAAIFEDQKLELYILEVYGFPSEEAAYESLSSIQAGLVWAALHHGISLPFTRQSTPVVYKEQPLSAETQLFRPCWEKGWDRVDGYYLSGYTVIKPEHKRLYVEASGSFSMILNVSDRELASTVAEAINFSNPEKLFHDDILRRALNIYMSSFFQFDLNTTAVCSAVEPQAVYILALAHEIFSVGSMIDDTGGSITAQIAIGS